MSICKIHKYNQTITIYAIPGQYIMDISRMLIPFFKNSFNLVVEFENFCAIMKNSTRGIISVLVLGLLFFGCKKNQTSPKVLDIIAGDSTSSDIHFVRLTAILNTSNAAQYYLKIGSDSFLVLRYSFYHSDPETYGSSFSINTVSNNVYICTDKNGYPVWFKQGELINDSLNWTNNGNGILADHDFDGLPNGYDHYYGNWVHTNTGFLAFKIVNKSITYKGWIRIGLCYVDNYACVAY